jgi:excisionase family DNA binding protein
LRSALPRRVKGAFTMSNAAPPVWMSVRQAAERTGTSMDTIRRALRAGKFPMALRESTGDRGWRISMADLVDAGFVLGAARPSEPTAGKPAWHAADGCSMDVRAEMARLREECAALRAENAKLREHVIGLLDRVVTAVGGPR